MSRLNMVNKILIIEDNVNILDTLVELFQLYDYETSAAVDAPSALSSLQHWNPDLILCDLLLPDGTGFEVLQQAQKNNIPAIVISGVTSPKERRTAMELGAQAYITKPFEVENLLKIVKSTISGS